MKGRCRTDKRGGEFSWLVLLNVNSSHVPVRHFKNEKGTEGKMRFAIVSVIATGRRTSQPLANFFPVPNNSPRRLFKSFLSPVPFSFFKVANAIEEIYLYLHYLQSQRILVQASLLLVIFSSSLPATPCPLRGLNIGSGSNLFHNRIVYIKLFKFQ